MLNLVKTRELTLLAPSAPARALHLSAASGLVRVGEFLYVVADDEHHLGVFPVAGNAPGYLFPLFAGELPDAKAERKALKPDLETLALLPAFDGYPNGALLALGSGSKRNRRKGVLLPLDVHGAISGAPRLIDLSDLYAVLREHIDDLNIEGAVVTADSLLLLQRGNKKHAENFIVELRLAELLTSFSVAGAAHAASFKSLRSCDLGVVDGVPLSFSDGAVLPDGSLVFTAIAENTEDSYNDGACVAAAVGVIDRQGTVRRMELLEHPHKIEGIDARVDGAAIRLLLVTDADDASVAASLFSAELDGYPFPH
jgi:hypothetical protein